MAFGFIKKVFSFGRKEVVEERPAEAELLPPLNLDALEELKPAAEQAAPAFLRREDVAPAESVPETPAEIAQEPGPAEEPVPASAPAEPQPAPTPQEVPEVPEPARPEPEEQPAPEPAPPVEPAPEEQPQPAPVEIPEEPRPERPGPEEQPVPAPQEVPASPSPQAPETPAPQEVPAPEPVPVEPELIEVPSPPQPAEIPQPPAEARSAEPEKVVEPLLPKPGKVTVAKKVEQKAEPQPSPEPAAPRRSWFQRMRDGLARSSKELSGNIAGVFTRRKLDEDTLQDLEDVLIRADLGVETALRVTDALAASRYGKEVSDGDVRAIMASEVEKVLGPVAMPLELDLSHKPHVVLVVGVNGTGKTTTIGKLAAKLTEGGLSVMLAAGDTFRAAAIEQLKIWGERTNSPVIATKLGADAAGLAYDAFERAKEAGSDVLIIDTAGRLQNKTELMAELEKIVRVLGKLDPDAPHTVLQTVDATTGQNALNQVEIFRNVAGVNGLVMTKLDGTARGGILVAIAAKHKLPVYFIGVGEQVDDLEPFSASEFARAIAGVA
ncbi:MAG: signal recognition particle-docking protein FtsY [Mesorhizobium sp.]